MDPMNRDQLDSDYGALEKSRWRGCWRLFGPGLLVCLADTDAGCLIVAAQSGSRWGYSLLLLQVMLIPALFLTQELTIRLGVYTKQGHTACIKQYFGAFWAWFACFFLVVECIGAMVSEMSGIAAVAEIWSLTRSSATIASAALIIAIVFACNYRQIEAIGVTLGLFELTFVVTMFFYRPTLSEVLKGAVSFPASPDFFKLVAANIGAVIMPWMVYFQQSAVVVRRLGTRDLPAERTETLVGSGLTQLVMIGTLVTLAATPKRDQDIETVGDIVVAMSPVLGVVCAKVLVTLAFVGGSLCASFVVALAASWAVCEAMGADDHLSLDSSPARAPAFYSCFLLVVCMGAVVLLAGVDIVKLNILVELMDGLLVPMSMGFLFLLAQSEALPEEVRVQGCHRLILAVIFTACSCLSIGSVAYSMYL